MARKLQIKKSNALVKSFYSLSLIEHRFICMCLGDIYYKKAIDGNTDLPVSVSRFAYVFHID